MMRLLWLTLFALSAAAEPLPVRGIHLSAPRPDEMDLALRFIREALTKEGVNTLVLEFNYRYRFSSRPEVVDEPPSPARISSALPPPAASPASASSP
jgi:hypothetical protein